MPYYFVEYKTPADHDHLRKPLLEHRDQKAALAALNALEAKEWRKHFRFAEDHETSDWRLASSRPDDSFFLVDDA
jgi:hypothetical protein